MKDMNENRKVNEKDIVWSLNILISFFICCRFFPFMNYFTSLVTENIVVNYLIVILNVVIGITASKQCGDNKKSIEKVINYILSIIFICVTMTNVSELALTGIIQIIFIISCYSICYVIILRIYKPNQFLFVLICMLIGTMVISGTQYLEACNQKNEEEQYAFSNKELYDRCKKLYDNIEEISPYRIIEYTDKSVYVQDLTSGNSEFYSFDTEEECNQFIKEHTMGIEVNIPVLGLDISFDNERYEVRYIPAVTFDEVIEKMQMTASRFFMVLMGWFVFVTLIGNLYEKRKKNIHSA